MTGIYELPAKPTARDIIARSIVAHPSLFRESLIAQARQHRDTMDIHRHADRRAVEGMRSQRDACLAVESWLRRDDLTDQDKALAIVTDGVGAMIALNVACKLQCLPQHIRTQAAIAWDDGAR